MRVSKVQIAKSQIETAIQLFFGKMDPFSVLTLAGAGEEILGNLLSRQQKKNFLAVMSETAAQHGLNLDSRAVASVANAARNALKHAKNDSEDDLQFDPEGATIMLMRATINYQLLVGELTDGMEEFLAWLRAERPQYLGGAT